MVIGHHLSRAHTPIGFRVQGVAVGVWGLVCRGEGVRPAPAGSGDTGLGSRFKC
jgi:hypothetical protein